MAIDLLKLASTLVCPICNATPKVIRPTPDPDENEPQLPRFAVLMYCDAGGDGIHFSEASYPSTLYGAHARRPQVLHFLNLDFDWSLERIRAELAAHEAALVDLW